MCVVDARQVDVVFGNERPNVELSPVRDREDAKVLTLAMTTVVNAPQLWTLIFWIPLTKRITMRIHALFCPRSFFIATSATKHSIKSVFGNRVEQRHSLQRVATCPWPGHIGNAPRVDRRLNRPDYELHTHVGNTSIPKLDHFCKVVAGINMHDRERNAGGGKSPHSQMQHHDRVFTPRKQQNWAFKLGSHLSNDRDRLINQATQRRLHEI